MRKFLSALRRVITFPFHLIFNIIVLPFRGLARFNIFLNTIPDEPPLDEVFVALTNDAKVRNLMWDQIEALRAHLLRTVIMFAFFCLLTFLYITNILNFLQAPLTHLTNSGLRISGPGNIFDIIPNMTFSSAFILATPYIIFEMWLFAAPGLRPRERKVGLILIPIFSMFSIMSLALGYYFILPLSLSTAISLTTQIGVYDWELSGYLSFTAKILMLSAIIVYYPFIVYLVSVRYNKPKIPLRLIILISFSLAAAITPGTMVLIDVGLAIVLSIIYIPTYLAITFLYKSPKKTTSEKPVE